MKSHLRKIKKLTAFLCFTMALVIAAPSCSSSKNTTSKQSTTTKKTNTKSSGKQTTLTDDRVEKNTSSKLSAACKKLGVSTSGVQNKTLYIESASWIGTKYKYGGQSSSGVDCSGLTGILYKKVYGKSLSRSSADILKNNCKKISKSSLKEGDLVFFRTDGKKSSTPNHVGIYLKENKFIHSSSSKGVIVSSMQQDYYVRNFITAGRVK